MRSAAAFLLLSVLASACLGTSSNSLENPGDEAQAADPILPTSVFATRSNDGRGATYRFDLRELDYQDSLLQFAIQAEEDLTVTMLLWVDVNGVGSSDECMVMGASSPGGAWLEPERLKGATRPTAIAQLVWRTDWDASNVHVRAEGQDLNPRPNAYPARVDRPIQVREEANWTVPAGETIFVHVGGSSPAFARDGFRYPARPNAAGLELSVSGNARIEPLSDAPIRCGTGFEQHRNGRLYANAGAYGHLALGGSVALESQNASTLVFWMDSFGNMERSATLRFLGKSVTIAPWSPFEAGEEFLFLGSEPKAGRIAIEVERWLEPLTQRTHWFLGDVWWPRLDLASAFCPVSPCVAGGPI